MRAMDELGLEAAEDGLDVEQGQWQQRHFADNEKTKLLHTDNHRQSRKATAKTAAESVKPADHLLNHMNEVTDKAFVTFSTFTAATVACQSSHGSKPGVVRVQPAPEPRAIVWGNIKVISSHLSIRHHLANMFVTFLIATYAVPITLVSLLVSDGALVSFSPQLARLYSASGLFASLLSMVQPLCVVIIQQLLPILFMAIGHVEGQIR